MRNEPEGGFPDNRHHASADAPHVWINPEDLYYHGKISMDRWLGALGALNPALRTKAEQDLQNTSELSTRQIADMFRSISRTLWTQNWGASFWGLSHNYDQIPIQKQFNNRLWTHNTDGTFNHITSDDLTPLFRAGRQEEWPNLVLTANHARAWRSEDLSELMQGVERLGADAWGKPLDLCRLHDNDFMPSTRGKTIMALACNTEKDIYLNGAGLIDRRLDSRIRP